MKKIIATAFLLICGSGAMAQDLKSISETGIIVEVIQKNPHQFVGKLIDLETQKTVSFISNRPVVIDELVIYILNARKESIQDEAKGFSSLIR